MNPPRYPTPTLRPPPRTSRTSGVFWTIVPPPCKVPVVLPTEVTPTTHGLREGRVPDEPMNDVEATVGEWAPALRLQIEPYRGVLEAGTTRLPPGRGTRREVPWTYPYPSATGPPSDQRRSPKTPTRPPRRPRDGGEKPVDNTTSNSDRGVPSPRDTVDFSCRGTSRV